MKTISLGKSGQVAIVDDADFARVSRHNWYLHDSNGSVYARLSRRIGSHRFILDAPTGQSADHINGNGLDNRRSNLRLCTHPSNNPSNRRKLSAASSRYKGVSLEKKSQLWRADIQANKKQFHLGCYHVELDAAIAYDMAARRHFGPWALTNFPATVYVASSWRNARQPRVVATLRAMGHCVYDFRNPRPRDEGFHWSHIDPEWQSWSPQQLADALSHPIACRGFASDMWAMDACNTCVLVLPSGRSAHLEAGYAAGRGKFVAILLADGEPELMYSMGNIICPDLNDLKNKLKCNCMFPLPEALLVPGDGDLKLRDLPWKMPETKR